MTIFNYDKQTRLFISKTKARENPLDKGKYLIPAFATTKRPLEDKEGHTQRFTKEESWEYVELPKEVKVELSEEEILRREAKAELGKLKVTLNSVTLDADIVSLGLMSNVISLANFKYNNLVAGGMLPEDAYRVAYKSEITWRNSDNENSSVQVETIAEILEIGMQEVGNVVTGN